MTNPKSAAQLNKLLDYILSRRPDEFGLVPDENGWIFLKDLLQAVNEEDGRRHVRQASINEILLTLPHPCFEMAAASIRAVQRQHLPRRILAAELPKLLYTGITRKSYPVALEKGLFPTRHSHIILSGTLAMAERIAKRRDPSPIILTINIEQAQEKGAVFYHEAGNLYTADAISAGCFSGPPLPKPRPEATPKKKSNEKSEKQKTPGSFILNLPQDPVAKKERNKGKTGTWKRDKKRIRRDKQKYWSD